MPSLAAVAVALLVGIVVPVCIVSVGRALGGSAADGWGAVPHLPRLLSLSLPAILVILLVPFLAAIGGLPHGYTVVELVLVAVLLGVGTLYGSRSGSRGWD